MQYIEPTFSNNRCFVSPILGCNGHCLYCYLAIDGYKMPKRNLYGIDRTIEFLNHHENFVLGKNGTIIAVGAWGDLFPLDIDLRTYSLEWIKRLLSLGNPVQIMSKNKLTGGEIEEIANSIRYANQLLYSTTIITFDNSNIIEKGVDNPADRILVLKEFEKRDIPTNIMIKPFIPGVTDTEDFIERIAGSNTTYCVVGKLYMDDNVLRNMQKNPILKSVIEKTIFDNTGKIGCVAKNTLHTYDDSVIDAFILRLQENNMKVFKKSSCVTANILKINNTNRRKYCVDGSCMECSNCIH